MSDFSGRPAATVRVVEMVVAALIACGGSVVIYDSIRLGSKWAEDGPQAGYFPFYIGLILVVSSAAIFFKALRAGSRATFVTVPQLKLVLSVLVPTAIYTAAIAWLGMYVASTLFIAWFMWVLGRYSVARILPVALGVSVFFFLLFEIWFKVPLPKGPLEAALGLN
ncbi:MAG: tripartite tricarboxylate transporter TctB family protein [Burkholderiales bacterium]|nr:tripartite tricarboxylate transporter TctB family protein [Burkholderiales bacterium]